MISLLLAFAVLMAGYFIYGRVGESIFAPDERKTPAYSKQDGVDFIPMPTWKAFLVQLLNIAGTGPIFGALMGACFGPVVFLWIIFGSVLGGGVHDYMSGMISERHDGASIAELSGIYLGKAAKWGMRIFSVVLLLFTGTVFVTSPAALLSRLTPNSLSNTFWIVVILLYYVLATLLPIDKIIGKLYPIFGAVLIIMALGAELLWEAIAFLRLRFRICIPRGFLSGHLCLLQWPAGLYQVFMQPSLRWWQSALHPKNLDERSSMELCCRNL